MSDSNGRHTLVVIISISDNGLDIGNNLNQIKSEGILQNYIFVHAERYEQAISLIHQESEIACVIINICSSLRRDFCNVFIKKIIEEIRSENNNLPIFLSSPSPILAEMPIDVVKEIHECININDDTSGFIAGRIHLAIHQYLDNLLPPYFRVLKNYTEDKPCYWDNSWHQGTVDYYNHPIGSEFLNFFDENISSADVEGVTPEIDNWFENKGAPGESEQRAAVLFGADKTFYVIGGASQSNQIVGHSIPLKGNITLVDRSCHQSVTHELTITQANPIYFRPSRNGLGIIGLISPDQFNEMNIRQKIKNSLFSYQVENHNPVYAIITNCTYDGLIYNVELITKNLANSTPRIKFDEAGYAYAKFHPIYTKRFAMDMPKNDPHQPTLYAVQSTHKILSALCSTSMIHIRNSERAPVNYAVFNEAFTMHETVSPFYPIIASIDVATAMTDGKALIAAAIDDAINFRKIMMTIKNKIVEENSTDWFFSIWQPETVLQKGKLVPFIDVPNSVLAHDSTLWKLNEKDTWHGFKKMPDGYAMLDPIKVTIICPGLNVQGEMSEFGIPAQIVTKYLEAQRITPARNGDYNILILFALGATQEKWGSLVDLLMIFKRHHDNNTPIKAILPDIYSHSFIYEGMGLADLCKAIHQTNIELNITKLSELACAVETLQVLTPSQAYDCLIDDNTELVDLYNIKDRTIGVMVTPYPPGIPLVMPGESINEESSAIIDYLMAVEEFGKRFPGFEHELQGIDIDESGEYKVRCIKEEYLFLAEDLQDALFTKNFI
ncbi:Orn/Lys/Arg decarboxylase N-terminal domain-containing protein [Pragia fontium]|uniref:Arginine decarboxylase n=1 Tax=Pragia fontium DSM 5563 = ATCC 49100 TaxID=1122977 RepID=A0AAJ5BIN4_9GAMM|nr:Orn/Lys/Arg decarboxylase N-terminal domain-containing protein [Pragia fontium]SFD42283.1 arginine decarboxylase [Pragia fontium DSM 5563 = ATCC 49100]